ncbi:MAG: LLM class F420-dependent oxidoreductase [Candidatus Dormibacteraeota bacterium]|nr:LLM class F420-dependent oxidoreductase [Candidatus Dormibacteraeota bacterium]
MKLGLSLGYWGSGPPADAAALLLEAERLGFDSAWTSEAYGSDALTPLAWWGSNTRTIRLGTAICQISARAPAATAMAALTLDHLSGGRFVLGLGVSGPQVVEGWYGQPFAKPLARTREYVAIVRQVLRRDAPLTNEGPHYPLPFPQGTGLAKPLKSIVYPLRAALPIIMGAEGPKNVALAAEIADGWFPFLFSPQHMGAFGASLEEGFARPGARRSASDFEVIATTPVIIDNDVDRAAQALKPMLALYIGGMGAREANFHFDVFVRMGFDAEARRVQQLYLDGQRREAVNAVPTKLVEQIALIGPRDKIRDELAAWRDSIATTLVVAAPTQERTVLLPSVDTLRTMAELVL